MNIAVIPARGGSKRIPHKNIRPFAGRPMITWPIDAALQSGLFEQVIVSTDDEEIAQTARDAGAHVPFVRPLELSGDHVGTIPVIAHAVIWAREQGMNITAACCIYATAPGIEIDDLARGVALLEQPDVDFAFAATDFAAPIFRAFEETAEGRVKMFWPEHFESRSQDLPRALHDAAQFYWGKADAWIAGKPLFGPSSAPIVIPRYRVQDIDTEEDWTRAEALFQALRR